MGQGSAVWLIDPSVESSRATAPDDRPGGARGRRVVVSPLSRRKHRSSPDIGPGPARSNALVILGDGDSEAPETELRPMLAGDERKGRQTKRLTIFSNHSWRPER